MPGCVAALPSPGRAASILLLGETQPRAVIWFDFWFFTRRWRGAGPGRTLSGIDDLCGCRCDGCCVSPPPLPSSISLGVWHRPRAGAGGRAGPRVPLEAVSWPRPQLISWITQEWHLQPARSRAPLRSGLAGNSIRTREKPPHGCGTQRRDPVGWGDPSPAQRGSPKCPLQAPSSGGCLPVKPVPPGGCRTEVSCFLPPCASPWWPCLGDSHPGAFPLPGRADAGAGAANSPNHHGQTSPDSLFPVLLGPNGSAKLEGGARWAPSPKAPLPGRAPHPRWTFAHPMPTPWDGSRLRPGWAGTGQDLQGWHGAGARGRDQGWDGKKLQSQVSSGVFPPQISFLPCPHLQVCPCPHGTGAAHQPWGGSVGPLCSGGDSPDAAAPMGSAGRGDEGTHEQGEE